MKVGILGNGRRGIGSRLLAALAVGAGWASPLLGGNNAQPVQRVYGSYRPTGTALRNPADPVQAARIEAAEAKRQRKARWLEAVTVLSVINNRAHAFTGQRHNSLYIAK